MSSRRRTRRWPLRLAQLSPLLGIALVAAIWSSLPLQVATYLAASISRPGTSVTPEMRREWLDLNRDSEVARQLHLEGGEGSLDRAAEQSWTDWVDSLPPRPDESAVLSPTVNLDPRVFGTIEEWERDAGARVWAWVVPAPQQPAVVASATGDPPSLNLVRSEFEGQQLGLRDAHQPVPDSLEQWLWWQTVGSGGGRMRALDVGTLQSQGGGYGGGGMFVTSFSIKKANQVWRAIVVCPQDGVEDAPVPSAVDAVQSLDPTARDFRLQVDRLVAKERLNIWVFGPVEWTAVPLRVPAGKTLPDAEALAARVWPTMAMPERNEWGSPAPETLIAAVARLAGGPAGTMRVTGINNTAYGAGTTYESGEIPPQTVAWLAVFDELPAVEPTGLALVWDSWQRFVSGWFPFLLGGAVAFLALTLVASPAAFVYERRLVARERVRAEMARMRRDAHDKVYNRLSALSKRVAAAGDQLSPSASASLSEIAEDIRDTVGELQEILGDEVRHTNSVLTTVPLADQISAVCRAQAARLNIAVSCTVAAGLPEISADLGWDFQCIAEEAINNAARHGHAAGVEVDVRLVDHWLALSITDDGAGSSITAPEQAPSSSQGLRGIEQRLARHAGTLDIESSEAGTTLTARVPL